ncbi:hypothetical protein Bca101_091640 [Brassica carinata]
MKKPSRRSSSVTEFLLTRSVFLVNTFSCVYLLSGEDKVKTVSRSGAIRVTAFVVFGVLCHVVSVSRQYHGVEQSESISL